MNRITAHFVQHKRRWLTGVAGAALFASGIVVAQQIPFLSFNQPTVEDLIGKGFAASCVGRSGGNVGDCGPIPVPLKQMPTINIVWPYEEAQRPAIWVCKGREIKLEDGQLVLQCMWVHVKAK